MKNMDFQKKNNAQALWAVGGAVGGLVVLAIIIGLAVYIYMLKKKTTGNPSNNANNSSTTAVATPMAAIVAVEMGAGPVVGVAKKIPISLKLEELGCGQYEAALADQGYDDMASLQGLSKEKAGEIADDVKMKPGHKRRFVDGFGN